MKWSNPIPQEFHVYGDLANNATCCIEGYDNSWSLDVISIGYVDVHVDARGTLEECQKKAEAAYLWATSKYPESFFEDESKQTGIHSLHFEP